DYYVKNTSNLIMNALVPWYQGANNSPGGLTAPLKNTGTLQTKGWNFTFISTNIETKNFRWESSLNLSHFKTIVTGTNSPNGFYDRVSWWMNSWTQRAAVGYEPWLFRDYVADGLFQSLEEIAKDAVPV